MTQPDTIKTLVDGIGDLVSLPGICTRVIELADDPNSTVNELGQVISHDPGLTTKILRMANSSYYSYAKEVETVAQAVSIIGMQRIRDLVLGTSAVEAFKGIPNELVTMEDFWMHSLYCGIAARDMATRIGNTRADSIFVGGLLHDIGQLAIFNQRPEESRKVLMSALEGPDDAGMDEVERQIMGFDHTGVGGALAEQWSLPAVLYECIMYHHNPEKAEQYPQEVSLVHIASIVAGFVEVDEIDDYEAGNIHKKAWEETGISADIIPDVMLKTREQFQEVSAVFLR